MAAFDCTPSRSTGSRLVDDSSYSGHDGAAASHRQPRSSSGLDWRSRTLRRRDERRRRDRASAVAQSDRGAPACRGLRPGDRRLSVSDRPRAQDRKRRQGRGAPKENLTAHWVAETRDAQPSPENGGKPTSVSRFVMDSANGMAVDAVIEMSGRRRMRRPDDFPRARRIMSKLALHAELGTDLARPRADAELRAGESSSRELGAARIQSRSHTVVSSSTSRRQRTSRNLASRVTEAPEPVRLIQMSLEMGADGPARREARSTTSLSVGTRRP